MFSVIVEFLKADFAKVTTFYMLTISTLFCWISPKNRVDTGQPL